MFTSSIWLFIIPFMIAAALPGPAQGTLIATVMTNGRTSAVSFVTGMVMGNAAWLVATIFGLASLALRYESLFIAIKWVGIAYLLLIAYKLWNAAPAIATPQGTSKGFVSGLLLTLGNPKAVVFFGAVLPQAFDLTMLSATDAMAIVALGAFIDGLVQSVYLMAALKARRFVSEPSHMRVVNRTAASVICGCALLIARR